MVNKDTLFPSASPMEPRSQIGINLLSTFLSVLVTLVTFFVLMFAYVNLAGPIPFSINSVTTSKSDAFSVSGEGRVKATPDSATVRLGVVAQAATSEAAKTLLNTNINKVIESAKALGIDEKDIKTENFNIYPEYGVVRNIPEITQPDDQNKISGYNANTNISIIVDDADVAGKVVDAGVAAGANQVGNIDFQVKDKDAALNQARELAVANAKKKAEDAARIAGFSLGKVINYSEGEGGGYPPIMAMKAEDSARTSAGNTQVQPGENEIVVTVTLSYEIR